MNTPILFIVFNRPDLVGKTLDGIRSVSPAKLFIAADGPRSNFPDDKKKCKEVRIIIENGIDWDCEVEYLYRDENLGCGIAVSHAISWFFSKVEKGIILEDDCLPNESFFHFCSEMLEKYKLKKKVFHISGSNWQQSSINSKADYHFSHFPAVWGWATWRDRWLQYSLDIINSKNKELVIRNLHSYQLDDIEINYHLECFNLVQENLIDTWDYQWRFLIFLEDGIGITPNKNLISNIGHRLDGTHTIDESHWRANMKSKSLSFPLRHPNNLYKVNHRADRFLIYKLQNVEEKNCRYLIKKFIRKFT